MSEKKNLIKTGILATVFLFLLITVNARQQTGGFIWSVNEQEIEVIHPGMKEGITDTYRIIYPEIIELDLHKEVPQEFKIVIQNLMTYNNTINVDFNADINEFISKKFYDNNYLFYPLQTRELIYSLKLPLKEGRTRIDLNVLVDDSRNKKQIPMKLKITQPFALAFPYSLIPFELQRHPMAWLLIPLILLLFLLIWKRKKVKEKLREAWNAIPRPK